MADNEYQYAYLNLGSSKSHEKTSELGNGVQAQVANQGTTTSGGAGAQSAFNRNSGHVASALGTNEADHSQ
jgi:hypothetical protein